MGVQFDSLDNRESFLLRNVVLLSDRLSTVSSFVGRIWHFCIFHNAFTNPSFEVDWTWKERIEVHRNVWLDLHHVAFVLLDTNTSILLDLRFNSLTGTTLSFGDKEH
jgi:hypothetical protein